MVDCAVIWSTNSGAKIKKFFRFTRKPVFFFLANFKIITQKNVNVNIRIESSFQFVVATIQYTPRESCG